MTLTIAPRPPRRARPRQDAGRGRLPQRRRVVGRPRWRRSRYLARGARGGRRPGRSTRRSRSIRPAPATPGRPFRRSPPRRAPRRSTGLARPGAGARAAPPRAGGLEPSEPALGVGPQRSLISRFAPDLDLHRGAAVARPRLLVLLALVGLDGRGGALRVVRAAVGVAARGTPLRCASCGDREVHRGVHVAGHALTRSTSPRAARGARRSAARRCAGSARPGARSPAAPPTAGIAPVAPPCAPLGSPRGGTSTCRPSPRFPCLAPWVVDEVAPSKVPAPHPWESLRAGSRSASGGFAPAGDTLSPVLEILAATVAEAYRSLATTGLVAGAEGNVSSPSG